MPPPKPENRKRRYHKRSRNGCDTCKAKHIRCDELKPLCTNCLIKGGSCGYSDVQPTAPKPTALEQKLIKLEDDDGFVGWDGPNPMLDMTPNNLFIGYPVDMNYDSRYLFDVFVNHRTLAQQPWDSFVIGRALSSPAFLHSALLLSAVNFTWNKGQIEQIRKSFLHHKLEAIKFVNHQLQEAETQSDDATLASIASLSLAESGLGSRDTATAHLSGLFRIIQMRDVGKPRRGNLLQSFVFLVGSSTMTVRRLHELLDGVDVGESLCISAFRLMLEQAGDVIETHGETDEKTFGEVFGSSSLVERIPMVERPSNMESRARWITCFFCLYATMGGADTDPFILSWFIEGVLDDLTKTEERMRTGDFPRQFWLWGTISASCAARVARASTELELRQINEWKRICDEKMRHVSQVMGLTDWTHVKGALDSWDWDAVVVPSEEAEFKEMWEDAVFGRNIVKRESPGPKYLHPRDVPHVQNRVCTGPQGLQMYLKVMENPRKSPSPEMAT